MDNEKEIDVLVISSREFNTRINKVTDFFFRVSFENGRRTKRGDGDFLDEKRSRIAQVCRENVCRRDQGRRACRARPAAVFGKELV